MGSNGLIALFYLLMRIDQKNAQKPKIEHFISHIEPIQRHVEIERGTIRHMCAVDSGMHIISTVNDYDTFSDMADLELFAEYIRYCNANSKAIAKEESKQYRY